MEGISCMASRLKGSARDKQRREEMLADLLATLADRGPEAVTIKLSDRFDALAETFSAKIKELRKQL